MLAKKYLKKIKTKIGKIGGYFAKVKLEESY